MPYETDAARFQQRVKAVEAEEPIQVLTTPPPTATAPTEGLPTDATIGRFYTFASRPAVLYTIGADNVWRAILLVPVV